jgi:hypothetical protein
MIGDHQRASHSASRRLIRSPYSSSSGAFDSYHCGRSHPAASKKTAPSSRSRAWNGARRTSRFDDAVGLVESLGRSRAHVRASLLMLPEAGDVGRVQVDLGLAVDHPLGHGLTDPRPLLDPHGGHRPQALDLGRLAEHRQPIGREREDAVDRVLHPDGLVADDLGHQLERMLHLLLEVGLRERELGGRERGFLDRRDLLGIVQDRAVRVGADLEAGPVLALVHIRVHVAHDRVLDV